MHQPFKHALRDMLFYLRFRKEDEMDYRVAVMSIIVEQGGPVDVLNELLHEYSEYIIGRMGIPYRRRGVSIISIAMDAPQNTIATLSGRIGKLRGVSVKTAYSGIISTD